MKENPTNQIDIGFSNYVKTRKSQTESHIVGGIIDYAYGADHMMMRKINAIPGAYKFFKALMSTWVPRKRQELLQNSLKVGPSQFSDVYEHTVECARILGVGIPTTFIENNPMPNAWAYASEDDAPVIVITSGFLERFTTGELKAVIGHELGHIQNNHIIYNNAVVFLANAAAMTIPGVNIILALVSRPLHYALMAWSRAAEVTADRAGLICCDDTNDVFSMEAKFMFGAAFNREDVNIDAILKQYDALRATPARIMELEHSHPIGARRILAAKTFMDSEVLYSWRPEWKEAGKELLSKQELDARCEKIIGVLRSNKRSDKKHGGDK